MIGFARILKHIIAISAFKSGRVTKARQDGSREFISLLACVLATGKWIKPLLVYPGVSQDLRTGWVQDIIEDSIAHFITSESGWTSNDIGQVWLQQVFERYTKPKRATIKRLLIVDGYSSYINMAFMDWADSHGIILLILPPYTTYRLQPLDVGLFQPLSTVYSKGLEKVISSGGGQVLMSKALFYSIFQLA